jgi:DNA mismatch endonuclease, patch repair protein
MRKYRPEDPVRTSARMAAIRSTGNRAEKTFRLALWRRGIRYRMQVRDLPGCPDLVIAGSNAALFIDGDFWHGRVLRDHGPTALEATFRGPRKDYWITRIRKNVERDDRTNAALVRLGWNVVRLWERDIVAEMDAPADAAVALLKKLVRASNVRCFRWSRDARKMVHCKDEL